MAPPSSRTRTHFSLALLERSFLVAAFLFTSGAILPVLQNSGGEGSVSLAGDPFSKPIQISMYFVAGLLLFRLRSRLGEAIREGRWLWVVTGVAVLSTVWSVDQGLTARTGFWLVLTALFGVYFALRFNAREQVEILVVVMAIAVLTSFAFALLPGYGVEPGVHGGDWRGVFIHKNSLGRAMSLAVLVFALWSTTSVLVAPIAIALTILALALIVLSHSGTALAGTLGLLGLVPVVWCLRRTRVAIRWIGVATIVGIAAVVTLGAFYWTQALGFLGRDATLTGRTTLWAVVVLKIAEKPWLGYGAQAFWHGRTEEYVSVWRLVGWAPPHAHNGFLDLLLDTGVVGLVVFVLCYAATVRRCFHVIREHSSFLEGAWPLGYLAFFLFSNLTESTILRHSSIFWILLASSITSVSLARRRLACAESDGGPEGRDDERRRVVLAA